jgi:hypothetical protein
MKRVTFLSVVMALLLCGVSKAGPIAYVVTSATGTGSGGQFGTMDLGTGAFNPIGPGDASGFDGLIAVPGGFLAINGNNDLVRLDPQTGAETLIGNAGVSLVVFNGAPGGPAFAADFTNNIYSINLSTGAATLIGSTGIPSVSSGFWGNSLTVIGSTLYYTYESQVPAQPSELYTLNTTTGAATPIGPTGASIIVGSGFVDHTFYGFTGFNGSQQIVTIDPATGAATPGAATPVIVFGAAQAVPEPTSVALLGIAMVGLFGYGRRWQRNRQRAA